MSDELAILDATAQADLVARGDVTPQELVEAAIERIERLNPELNAIIHPKFESARVTADGEIADGPFRGVPFLVKDAVCHTEGDPYHLGMRFLKDRKYVSPRDTELARRFRAAGFVFVGKTNTPELALSATTEPLAYGATRGTLLIRPGARVAVPPPQSPPGWSRPPTQTTWEVRFDCRLLIAGWSASSQRGRAARWHRISESIGGRSPTSMS